MADPTVSIWMNHLAQTAVNGKWGPTGGYGPIEDRLGYIDINSTETVSITSTDGHIDVFLTMVLDGKPISYAFWQKKPSTDDWGYAVSPMVNATNLAVAQNADGRVELFGTDAGGNIWHAWQTVVSRGPWASKAFGGQAKKLTLIRGRNGCLNLFYLGSDNVLWHNFQTAPNSQTWGYNKFPYTGKQITSGMNSDGRIEVVFTDMNNKIFSISEYAPGSTQWHYGPCGDNAALGFSQVVNQADGRLCFAYIGTNTVVYFLSQSKPSTGPWLNSTLGGGARQLYFSPALKTPLSLLYVGIDYNVYQQTQTAENSAVWHEAAKIASGHALCLTAALNHDWRVEVIYLNGIESRLGDPNDGDGGGGTLDPMPGGGDVDEPDGDGR